MKKILVSFMFMLVTMNAYSNPTCAGKISGVSISGSGAVYASIKSGSAVNLTDVVFCRLDTTEGEYSSESCKGVLSLLMAGSAMDKTATMWFRSESFDGCTLNWATLKNSGFYHFKLN